MSERSKRDRSRGHERSDHSRRSYRESSSSGSSRRDHRLSRPHVSAERNRSDRKTSGENSDQAGRRCRRDNPEVKIELVSPERDPVVDSNFRWEDHKATLGRIFFRDKDIIQRGSEEYKDFWAFLKKYECYRAKRPETSKAENSNQEPDSANNSLELPSTYDKRYRINFSVMTGDTEEMLGRAAIDWEERGHLPKSKVAEFRYILLLYLDFCQKQRFTKLRKLRESQQGLPMAQHRDNLLDTIGRQQVTVVAGDTGCGKSTQVPRYLLEAGYGQIACTQPRRLACIALSKRVAYETLNEYGSQVGYQIRFDKSKTQHTRILFLTEGLLLRQIATDPMLSMYNVVILDEVHERHLHSDFLLGVVKCMVRQRPDLKVILMSATINIDLFSNYFWNAPVIQVPGRLFPIQTQYRPISEVEKASRTSRINPAPYVRIMQMIDEKYPDDERGDLLIFLSGMAEITTVVEAAQLYAQKTKRWIILSLHSTLSLAEQDKVFDYVPDGTRKCIVSTNIAETSITIDGIRFVVDSGKVKEMNYDPSCKMQRLQEFWISKASAEQRKGRAGRTGPGVCFRLFSESEYSEMADYSTPEIHRVPLDSQILQMISLGLPDVRKFPFIEPPSAESVEEAVSALKAHGALSSEEELTPVGRMLSNLPVDITIGKLLIMGSLFDKVGPVLSLAAALSVQSPFTNKSYRDLDAIAARRPLESDHGDPFTLLSAYNEWLVVKGDHKVNSRQWCKRRGLEEQRFYEMTKLRKQFDELLRDAGLLQSNDSRQRGFKNMSSTERSMRHGELKRLRELKRDFHTAPKKRKLLKLEDGEGDGRSASDEEGQPDIRDIDFKIQHDRRQVQELSVSSKDYTYRDLLMLKIILCSGLYPQFALADEHNSYKSGADHIFHTRVKPFVILHPMSVFSNQPESLALDDGDIMHFANFESRLPASNRHQLIVYVSLLETTKPYLMNTMRIPAIQSLLLFSTDIDTDHRFSRIVFDGWLEVRFPDPVSGQDFAMQAMEIRRSWSGSLRKKLEKDSSCVDDDNLIRKLVGFSQEEVFYTIRRLQAADVKHLYVGPADHDQQMLPEWDGASPHSVKGGFRLTDFLTYNCLQEGGGEFSQTYLQSKWSCPFCEETLMVTVLERIRHQASCKESMEAEDRVMTDGACRANSNDGGPNRREYDCPVCNKKLFLSNTETLKHMKTHKPS